MGRISVANGLRRCIFAILTNLTRHDVWRLNQTFEANCSSFLLCIWFLGFLLCVFVFFVFCFLIPRQYKNVYLFYKIRSVRVKIDHQDVQFYMSKLMDLVNFDVNKPNAKKKSKTQNKQNKADVFCLFLYVHICIFWMEQQTHWRLQ